MALKEHIQGEMELVREMDSWVFDVGTEDFETQVIAASMETPIIVDFWAPWCGPCKQLVPALEAAVMKAGGEVLLAKVNLDENQQLAAALRVQSVPTVYAFFQGRPVDAFQGVLPERQITAFLDKIIQVARQSRPDAIDIPETLKAAAEALTAGDLELAQGLYMQVLQQDEKNVQAYTGLVRSFIAAGEIDQATQMVENAPDDIASNPAFAEAKTAVELASAAPVGDLSGFLAAVEKDPNDHQARIDLAEAQFSNGQKAEAIDTLLESIRMDYEWNEAAARKELLKIFEALGFSDPLAIQGRKKLSSILFS